jgi:hypothetical protein
MELASPATLGTAFFADSRHTIFRPSSARTTVPGSGSRRPASAPARKPTGTGSSARPPRPQSARPQSAAYSKPARRGTHSAVSSRTPERLERLRRYYFNKLPKDGGGGEGTRQFYDVVLSPGDALDSFPSQCTTYSYADFLRAPAAGEPAPPSQLLVDGQVDVVDLEQFLAYSAPRTWRDAYPLYVLAKSVLRGEHLQALACDLRCAGTGSGAGSAAGPSS